MGRDKGIGFDRHLELAWLNEAAGLVLGGVPAEQIRPCLMERLAPAIAGQESRAKTVGILYRTWVRSAEIAPWLHQEAVRSFAGASPGDRLMLHYGLVLLAYPFFGETARGIGQAVRQGGRVSESTVYRTAVRERGELGTLLFAVRRVLRTLRNWGCLVPATTRGAYREAPPVVPDDEGIGLWLLAASLTRRGAPEVTLRDVLAMPEVFPFAFPGMGDPIRRSPLFEVHAQGGGMELVRPTPRT